MDFPDAITPVISTTAGPGSYPFGPVSQECDSVQGRPHRNDAAFLQAHATSPQPEVGVSGASCPEQGVPAIAFGYEFLPFDGQPGLGIHAQLEVPGHLALGGEAAAVASASCQGLSQRALTCQVLPTELGLMSAHGSARCESLPIIAK